MKLDGTPHVSRTLYDIIAVNPDNNRVIPLLTAYDAPTVEKYLESLTARYKTVHVVPTGLYRHGERWRGEKDWRISQ